VSKTTDWIIEEEVRKEMKMIEWEHAFLARERNYLNDRQDTLHIKMHRLYSKMDDKQEGKENE